MPAVLTRYGHARRPLRRFIGPPRMDDEIVELDGVRLLVRGAARGPLGDTGGALDMIAEAGRLEADWVVVPVEQLGERFLDLSTGLAGDVVQRFVLYRVKLAVMGDIEAAAARSAALRAFVAEAGRGRQLRFVPSVDALRPE